ncbi:MAG: hypothetical protein HOP21_05115 [Methylotenera sp.]|nr:hypothetical protein [Methylotenera sp.]
MAFVREVITTEEDKNLYDSMKVVWSGARDKNHTLIARVGLTTWVIDRERGIYMFGMGGGQAEVPLVGHIVMPLGRIEFQAFVGGRKTPVIDAKLHPNKSYISTIDVVSVAIEPPLGYRKAEILQLIKETLAIEKGVDRPDGVLTVEVSFHPRITQD